VNTTNPRSILQHLANAGDDENLRKLWWENFRTEQPPAPPDSVAHEKDFSTEIAHAAFVTYLVRRLWVADEEAVAQLQEILVSPNRSLTLPPSFFSVDWRRESFVYQPRSELQRTLYFLLQHASLLKLCANVDCPRPHFIAIHGNDRYCSKKCFDLARKAAKRAWWDEHGEQWRSGREKLKKRQSRKKRK
jgi:hypothetical protein